ncbi:dihydrolipoyl dehydrogenase family protein [Arthrobacter castelli]|uniref:dihydrolipoyl dehydrogenase family protein n=1 Tax=Arthrobacter castelli TaxID=271431 RepID=UPI0004103594|nr:NAD(P)/FAD-dependent oxidoreductase [Arthrobacter castelli]
MSSETRQLSTDVIVIGAGAVGENAAGRAVQNGLKAVLVEAALIGGECSYWACMPSKALLRPGIALHGAQAVAGSREAVTDGLNVQSVLKRRDSFTSHWDDSGQQEWVSGAGIELLRGAARISGERTVEVTADDGTLTSVTAGHAVVVATGSTPAKPPIDGLETIEYWTTPEATSAREVPPRLAVIGGGVAGTELAQAFARLGSEVTMVVRTKLLDKFPAPAGELVADALAADGIDLRIGAEAATVARNDDGTVALTLRDGSALEADQLLVATGRRPATADLGLESVGVDAGNLSVDPSGRISGAGGWLYAVGDAAGNAPLTHQGKYEARVAGDAIAARAHGTLGEEVERWSKYAATADESAVPQVVFSDPEVAMVGLTEDAARDRGLRVSTVQMDIAVAGSALHADDYTGWVQMVVDEERTTIAGMTFVGQDVAELLHAATVAVVGQVPLHRLWHAVPSYPTISEIWLRLLEEYGL